MKSPKRKIRFYCTPCAMEHSRKQIPYDGQTSYVWWIPKNIKSRRPLHPRIFCKFCGKILIEPRPPKLEDPFKLYPISKKIKKCKICKIPLHHNSLRGLCRKHYLPIYKKHQQFERRNTNENS